MNKNADDSNYLLNHSNVTLKPLPLKNCIQSESHRSQHKVNLKPQQRCHKTVHLVSEDNSLNGLSKKQDKMENPTRSSKPCTSNTSLSSTMKVNSDLTKKRRIGRAWTLEEIGDEYIPINFTKEITALRRREEARMKRRPDQPFYQNPLQRNGKKNVQFTLCPSKRGKNLKPQRKSTVGNISELQSTDLFSKDDIVAYDDFEPDSVHKTDECSWESSQPLSTDCPHFFFRPVEPSEPALGTVDLNFNNVPKFSTSRAPETNSFNPLTCPPVMTLEDVICRQCADLIRQCDCCARTLSSFLVSSDTNSIGQTKASFQPENSEKIKSSVTTRERNILVKGEIGVPPGFEGDSSCNSLNSLSSFIISSENDRMKSNPDIKFDGVDNAKNSFLKSDIKNLRLGEDQNSLTDLAWKSATVDFIAFNDITNSQYVRDNAIINSSPKCVDYIPLNATMESNKVKRIDPCFLPANNFKGKPILYPEMNSTGVRVDSFNCSLKDINMRNISNNTKSRFFELNKEKCHGFRGMRNLPVSACLGNDFIKTNLSGPGCNNSLIPQKPIIENDIIPVVSNLMANISIGKLTNANRELPQPITTPPGFLCKPLLFAPNRQSQKSYFT